MRGTLDVASEAIEALSAQDVERMIGLTDPDIEWYSFFADLKEGGVYRGHDGLRQYVADLLDAFEFVRVEVAGGLAVGEIALLVGRIHVRGGGSGIEATMPAGWVLKVRSEKVVSFRAFREPERAIEDLGAP